MSKPDTKIPSPSQFDERNNLVELQFEAALNLIDHHFGEDYSKKNPNLVAAVLQAMVAAFKS